MATTLNALEIRRRLGRDRWAVPREFGEDGWLFLNKRERATIIVSVARWDGVEWAHISMSRFEQIPDYFDLKLMHHAVWQERGWSYQVFPPTVEHVNIHETALHLWGRVDGQRPECIPNFGEKGTI